MTVKAPITETLASALLMLTPWKKDRILVDPFCGSGTFPIEAAMMAADMAPGMNRHFLAESWEHLIPKECWEDAREEARERVNLDIETDIQGFDIDAGSIKGSTGQCKDGRSGQTDPFSAETGQRTPPLQTVWFYCDQSALW